jgi:WD40-like Beta Propeller Repeat
MNKTMKPHSIYHAVTLNLPKSLCLFGLLIVLTTSAFAQEFKNVAYLCADWGPAMTLSTKPSDKPQFDDTQEEVYFLKQVNSFTRKKLLLADPFSGNKTEDIGHGISIYLCKMKANGGQKTEIKVLWKNPNYPIDTQGASTWMDVNEKTHKIVVSVLFGGSDLTGLWTMNMDGSDLKQIVKPEWGERLTGVDHPSWTPDGRQIVFEERLRGVHPNRFNIAICDADGGRFKRLLESTDKIEYRQPSVSPDGKIFAFSRSPNGYPGGRYIWLANIDGSEPHPLVEAKRVTDGWGDYPAWSPDGKHLYALGAGILDVETGRVLNDHRPKLNGKPWAAEYVHWGTAGLLGSATSFRITLTDSNLVQVQLLCASGLEEVK